MNTPRQLPLEAAANHSSWSENMAPGEYAVHYSTFNPAISNTPFCTVFGTLAEAEAFASDQVALDPSLRCTIYDHHGRVGAPIRDIRGTAHKGEGEISKRFRRWVGLAFLFTGFGLIAYDWINDFRLSWPALIGSRLLFPGGILLVTEAVLILQARKSSRQMSGAAAR